MPVIAFDIMDTGIRAARSDSDEPLKVDGESTSSPGVALVTRGGVVTGVDAAHRACFHPSTARSRFWERLGAEPLDASDPRSGNQAELALAHLRAVAGAVLREGDRAVFALPADYTARQLGIVVSIANELGIALEGVAPRPIAFDAGFTPGCACLFLDVGLHRSVLSIVDAVEGESDDACLVLRESHTCPDVGIDPFRRRWAKAIGGEFLRATRFDPLHDAASEQQLLDLVQPLADAIGPSGAEPLELRAGGRSHEISVTRRLLSQASEDLVRALAASAQSAAGAGGVSEIIIGGGAGRVPGLEEALVHRLGTPVRWLEPEAAAIGLARMWPGRFPDPGGAGVALHTWRRATATPAATG